MKVTCFTDCVNFLCVLIFVLFIKTSLTFRKKKEAALQMCEKEEARSDSDTASDQQSM